METKEQLVTLINTLPISQEEKTNLLGILETDGVETIKVILRAAIEEAVLKAAFKDELDKREQQFQDDMKNIEAESKQLATDVAKQLDTNKLEALKKTIVG